MDYRGTLMLISLLLGIEAAAAAGIKRWLDAEGNVHFGDTPPVAAATQEVTVETRPVDRGNSRRLKKASSGWLRHRLADRTIPVKVQPDPSRDFTQRLRFKNARRQGQLLVGMRPAEVRSLLGRPTKISANKGVAGVREQWLYIWPDKKKTYVTLQDGKVSGWR
jgi:hypothetical protein